jgi:(E)-4-hydroxy-3-methylbut-2-enyl-diphosphate synthase
MANTDTKDIQKTVRQIKTLQRAGCEIIRAAVYDIECAYAIGAIKKKIQIPLVADIHFDYKLAISALENGADKIRINPGNLGGAENLIKVTQVAKKLSKPIRIGVNAGSLEKEILAQYGKPCAEALAKSALLNVRIMEGCGFGDIVVSIKSSDVCECVQACRMFSDKCDYPLHIGVTEAGDYETSIIKSSAALGALLLDGIGDTLRISITGNPVNEIKAAQALLQYCGIRSFAPEIISCPTCARTGIDVEAIVKLVRKNTKDIHKPIKIAVMGCIVNGPGEAKEADIGVAGGQGKGALFAKGQLIKTVPEERLAEELIAYIREYLI